MALFSAQLADAVRKSKSQNLFLTFSGGPESCLFGCVPADAQKRSNMRPGPKSYKPARPKENARQLAPGVVK